MIAKIAVDAAREGDPYIRLRLRLRKYFIHQKHNMFALFNWLLGTFSHKKRVSREFYREWAIRNT